MNAPPTTASNGCAMANAETMGAAAADPATEAVLRALAAARQEAADAKAANEAHRIAAEAAVVHASPSAPAGRAAPSTALVLIDFDQVGTKDATQVLDLLTNMMDKLVRDGLAAGKAQVTLEAYGLCFSNKYNPVLIRNLTRLGVEMKTVSSAKKEETDRHIERAARATEAPVVVIVSSDQDFVATAKELGQSGKKAVLVHDARAGSSHEKLMGFYSDAWRCDYFVPGWGPRKYEAPTGQQACGTQASSWRNPANAASTTIKIDGEDVPESSLMRNKMFDERNNGRTQFQWCNRRDCQEGLECTFAHRKPPARAQTSELTFKIQGEQVPASELVENKAYHILKKDPTAKLIWCAHAQRCEKRLECTYVHRKPEAAAGAQTSSSTQDRAQTFKIQGKDVPTSELVRNGLFEVMKANPDHKAQWCPQQRGSGTCKKGLACKLAHLKKDPSANAAGATLKIDGEDVPVSDLVRNKMFDENNGRTQFQWCNRRDCQEGLECTFAHRKTEAAQASELTFKIQGKQVPASTLVKNRAYLAMKNNADHKVIWCRHRDACEDRLECTFAHRKPEAAAGAQASPQAPKATFKIQGKEVPTSELVKNGLFEVMKANPDHKAQWCPQREACKKGSECRLGHLKNEAQPASATLKIDGEDVPVSDLVRNKMFDERNNGRTEFKWCNRRDCQEGLECTFAHRKTEAVARAQASELTFKIQGKQVPASELVKNQAYLILKKDPTAKLIWCAHAQRCKKGLECTYAHRKPEAAAGAQTSSSTQARAQASELTFKILGKPVLASELVKNRAYLKMKNNADHKVIWCRHHDACEEGLECTYAHRKSAVAAAA